MAQYGTFDPQSASPHPITAWYDTEFADYGDALPPPEQLVELTPSQWTSRMDAAWGYDGTELVQLPPPPPSAQQVYQEKIAEGIAITSGKTPALNATYSLMSADFAALGSIARDAQAGLGLPGDASTVPIKDLDGGPHDFGSNDVVNLYKAERDLIAKLGAQRDVMAGGGEPTWPPQSATIT